MWWYVNMFIKVGKTWLWLLVQHAYAMEANYDFNGNCDSRFRSASTCLLYQKYATYEMECIWNGLKQSCLNGLTLTRLVNAKCSNSTPISQYKKDSKMIN